jgi:hypothetical protein
MSDNIWTFTKQNFKTGYICKDYENNWFYITNKESQFLFKGETGLVYPITNTDFVYVDTKMTFYSLQNDILTELNTVERDINFENEISFKKTLNLYKKTYDSCEETIKTISNGYSLRPVSSNSFIDMTKVTKIFDYDFKVDKQSFYQFAFILSLWKKEDNKWVKVDKLVNLFDDEQSALTNYLTLEKSMTDEYIRVYYKDSIFRYEIRENKIFKN